MPFNSPADAADWIRAEAQAFMASPANDLHMTTGPEPAFGEPLLGFSKGDDPLWDAYKEHVGPYHWTPLEAFAIAYPQEQAQASELSVVSWVLPQTAQTLSDHRKEKELPSERWARSRILGEKFVHKGLREHMVASLVGQGLQAVSPMLLPQWSRMDSERFVFASTWSERHAAYVAGLGTFGLCDGLITPVGKAMRVGSLVVRHPLPVSERPYTQHQEYCLFYSSGTCGICMKRCPANALTPAGHDKLLCKAYIREKTAPFVEASWGFAGYGCGFCQVNVPCETRIPPRPKKAGA